MKLMMFEKSGGPALGSTLGLVEGDSVIDLAAADASLPKDLASLIAAGPSALAGVKAAAGKAPASAKLRSRTLPNRRRFLIAAITRASVT